MIVCRLFVDKRNDACRFMALRQPLAFLILHMNSEFTRLADRQFRTTDNTILKLTNENAVIVSMANAAVRSSP